MENEQILKLAIKKARDNGWNKWGMYDDEENIKCPDYKSKLGKMYIHYHIFSHDFAKAFWGEEDKWKTTKCTCTEIPDFHVFGHDAHQLDCARCKADRGYKFHLQMMVLEENPLKYLTKFLN